MNRRSIFGVIGLVAIPVAANAGPVRKCFDQNQNSVDWAVPNSINKIRVQSWTRDGNEVIDTHFSVKPGQKFKISAVD